MGTRSLTMVYTEEGESIVNMYRQYDGYREGHGRDLAEFLNSFEAITNGIQFGETRKTANGMGCLAAQMIAHFKKGVGGFYIHPVAWKDCGQDYEYHLYHDKVKVIGPGGGPEFIGTWKEFYNWATADSKEPA